MRILGISPLDTTSTVSFMEDGKVVFACAEERLSRVKLQDGFPKLAIDEGFQVTGWTPESIDHVAYAFFDGTEEGRLIDIAFDKDAKRFGVGSTSESNQAISASFAKPYQVDRSRLIPGITDVADEFVAKKSWLKKTVYRMLSRSPRLDWMAHRHVFRQWVNTAKADHQRWTEVLDQGLQDYGLQDKLVRFHHHDTHAANAFFGSGFDSALAITLDGYGSGCCGGVYKCENGKLTNLKRFDFPSSMGIFYEHVTSGLGYKPSRHEGKIVGLASYGDSSHLHAALKSRFQIVDGEIQIKGGMNHFLARALADHFASRDVAAAYQDVLDEVTQELATWWVHETGIENIVVSGGVHANVKLNQRIHEVDGVRRVFVYPNMSDGGCGTGAAMLAFSENGVAPVATEAVYYGPNYSDSEIEAALQAEGLEYTVCDEVEDEIAALLTKDHIVARFNGGMEYGPRALGNRSILYPPKDPEVNQWLNHQLGRTEFMPFAPAVMQDLGHRLFANVEGCEKTAEFMTVTFNCNEEMKSKCPAAVHVDGTARPQFVSPETNASFYKILKKYYELSGIPALINTSFNMHEEPIVCSPADGIRAFLLGNIDYLAIGSCLVKHPKPKDRTEA
ncbi:MAG: carbamoyltransferase C-terminal domain-containing protein [Fuerstiella sp.]